jgi:hypothetical protein
MTALDHQRRTHRRAPRRRRKPVYCTLSLPAFETQDANGHRGRTSGWERVRKARDFVDDDFQYELRQKSKRPSPCSEETTAQLETDYPDGNAVCYENTDGVFINWRYRKSPVAAQLYFEPGTSPDVAVAARAKLL